MKLLGIPSSSSSSSSGGEGKPRWEVVNGSGTKELKNILKHFAIEVENPCCVLTQEYSKKFIQVRFIVLLPYCSWGRARAQALLYCYPPFCSLFLFCPLTAAPF